MNTKKKAAAPTTAPKAPSTHQNSTLSGNVSSPVGPVRRNVLTSFSRENCSNWNGDKCIGVDGIVLFNEGPCLVMLGKPCPYFEKSVFPLCDPAYPYADAKAVKQYGLLVKLYRKCNPNVVESEEVDVRLCDCGASLLSRQRVCEKCRRRRRLDSYRRNRQKSKA